MIGLNTLNLSPAEYYQWYATGVPPKRYAHYTSHSQPATDMFDSSEGHQASKTSHFGLGSLLKATLYGGLAYFSLKHFAPAQFQTLASVAQSGFSTAVKYAGVLADRLKTVI